MTITSKNSSHDVFVVGYVWLLSFTGTCMSKYACICLFSKMTNLLLQFSIQTTLGAANTHHFNKYTGSH